MVGGTFNISITQGSDGNPTSHLVGSAAIVIPDGTTAATAVAQRISGLLPGVLYILQAVVTTSSGNTKSLWSHCLGEQVD